MSLRNAPVTIALVLINIAIYLIDSAMGGTLMQAGAIIPSEVQHGQYYRIFASGFLHFNFQHILFNMYALVQSGMVVESFYGSLRFALIYFIAMACGGLLAYETTLGTNEVTAGASGAIMGLFGAMVSLGLKTPQLRGTLVRWALFPIAATLFVGFTSPGISNAGHIGGVIGGAISAFIIPPARLRKPNDYVEV